MVKKNLVWIFLGLITISNCALAVNTSTPTPAPTATATVTGLMPSQAFTAVDPQGRPMVGATITITDPNGNPINACGDSVCSFVQTQVNGTGVFQFYGVASATYNVLLSGIGVSRQYVVVISCSGGGGGSGITSINTLTAAALTINNDNGGTDFSISQPDSTHITLHVPSAGIGVRGLVTTGGQVFQGAKTFVNTATFATIALVNSTQVGGNVFTASSMANTCAFNVDATNDQVDVGSCDNSAIGGKFSVVNNDPLASAAIVALSNSTGSGIVGQTGSGYGVQGIVTGGAGAAVQGTSTIGTSRAGQFIRSVNGSSVPVLEASRNAATDTTPLLNLADQSATSGAQYVVKYTLSGGQTFGINSAGQFKSAYNTDLTTVAFASIATPTMGLGFIDGDRTFITTDDNAVSIILTQDVGTAVIGKLEVAVTAGSDPALAIDNSTSNASLNIDSGNLVVSHTGELTFAGVASDGTGKTLCVKADGDIGSCGDTPDSSGVCTCG